MNRIIVMLMVIIFAQSVVSFATNSDYALPSNPSNDESVQSKENESVQEQEVTEEISKEDKVEEVTTETGKETAENPLYALPESDQEVERTENEQPKSDDEKYMEKMLLAFLDDVTIVTPDNPNVVITAAMARVPQEKIGSAQWLVNGEPRGDYYSSEFPIYSGRTTSFYLNIPFDRETQDHSMSIALEVHLNGVVRKIEKTINIDNYDAEWYNKIEYERVLSIVKPVEIEATVNYWTNTYNNSGLNSINGSVGEGCKVIYTDHSGTYAAKVWIPIQNRMCWVPYGSIRISSKNYTVYEDFSDVEKELFVEAKGYESDTDYLVWVNLERQKVNTFVGSKGNWELVRTSTCASGANITPTPVGTYTYCAKANGWFHPTYYVKPVLYINLQRGIALHSILFNPNGTVQDGTQGTPASHGCIRMPLYEVNWLASYVPIGSTVVVY